MKLHDFVKKEPLIARMAILWLSVTSTLCLAALIAVGGITAHKEAVRLTTNVKLIASDILSLRDALEINDDTEARIKSALIAARSESCLNGREAQTLNKIILAKNGEFSYLCEQIEALATQNGLGYGRFKEVLREIDRTKNFEKSAASTRRTTEQQTADQVKESEKFFGIQDIFHSADKGAYCENLYISFSGRRNTVSEYAVECTPLSGNLSANDYERKINEFSKAKLWLSYPEISGGAEHGGIYWAEISENGKSIGKIGVRSDTGAICFFRQVNK